MASGTAPTRDPSIAIFIVAMFFTLQPLSEVDTTHYLVGDSIMKKPFSIAEAVSLTQPHIMKALKFFKNKYMAIQFIVSRTNIRKDIYPFEGVSMFCMRWKKRCHVIFLFRKNNF